MEVHAFNNQEVYSNNQINFLTTNNIYKPVKPVMNFLMPIQIIKLTGKMYLKPIKNQMVYQL